jgi:glutathione synthase/RimK-type ligase-like ATP-grasp enzyme
VNFLGIYREPEFSPGRHTSNDALILRLVGQALERQGVKVRLVALEEARTLWQKSDLIFSMCQGPVALKELSEWKKKGAHLLNDPEGSLHTYREALYHLLTLESLPFPRSVTLATDGSAALQHYTLFFETGSAWLKRADVHATGPEDVVRIQQLQDLAPALESFRARGLATAILQEHIEGDEVKFYAVRGDHFFWPYYPKDCIGHPFDEDVLQKIADAAARVLGVNVYGGDAIISPNGKITLIDVNDWPSFAPCRGAAAHAIAKFLKETYAKQNRKPTSAIH